MNEPIHAKDKAAYLIQKTINRIRKSEVVSPVLSKMQLSSINDLEQALFYINSCKEGDKR